MAYLEKLDLLGRLGGDPVGVAVVIKDEVAVVDIGHIVPDLGGVDGFVQGVIDAPDIMGSAF